MAKTHLIAQVPTGTPTPLKTSIWQPRALPDDLIAWIARL